MKLVRAVLPFAWVWGWLLAQEKPEATKVVKLAPPWPVSTQGKAAEANDIVVDLKHAPDAGAKCEADAGCSARDHWQVEVRVGSVADAQPKTIVLAAADELKTYLEWAASPKAKTKHADRVNVSDATLALRVPAATPWSIVHGVIQSAAAAGVQHVEFAVVPGADGAEQRLRVPLPADRGQAARAEEPQQAPEQIRVALYQDAAKQQTLRQFGKNILREEQLRDVIRDVHADRIRMGKPDLPVTIDAASGVPWQSVVGVIDICHALGVAVEFAAKPAKK